MKYLKVKREHVELKLWISRRGREGYKTQKHRHKHPSSLKLIGNDDGTCHPLQSPFPKK